jgi:hypothetical protein
VAAVALKWLTVPGGAIVDKDAALVPNSVTTLGAMHEGSRSELVDDQDCGMGWLALKFGQLSPIPYTPATVAWPT